MLNKSVTPCCWVWSLKTFLLHLSLCITSARNKSVTFFIGCFSLNTWFVPPFPWCPVKRECSWKLIKKTQKPPLKKKKKKKKLYRLCGILSSKWISDSFPVGVYLVNITPLPSLVFYQAELSPYFFCCSLAWKFIKRTVFLVLQNLSKHTSKKDLTCTLPTAYKRANKSVIGCSLPFTNCFS